MVGLRTAAKDVLDEIDRMKDGRYNASIGVSPASREALRVALAQQDVCDWKANEKSVCGYWETACGEAYPTRKGFTFCPDCGKPIKFLESENEPK